MSQSMTYGDLVLQFTSKFTLRWNDKGSGGDSDGAFWQPVPPAGFKALGSIGVSGYGEANGNYAALCVKEAQSGSGALKSPERYDFIWSDRGSGADRDGSCWRPIPPAGYVALGDVFASGYNAPSLDDVACVRADLVADGVIGNWIYDDRGSGADRDISTWQIQAPVTYVDATKGLIAVNSFVGVPNYSKPTSSPVARCLCLPFPAEAFQEPEPPVLTSKSRPPATTPREVDHIVWVPFTAVQDPGQSLSWKVENSPFYQLQRQVWYDLLLFDDNRTTITQEQEHSESVGITTTESQTFSVTTGVSVTAEGGVSFLGTGGKVSATVSVELGYQYSTGIQQFHSKTVTVRLTTPSQTAAAVWAASYAFRLVRSDGALIPAELDFVVDSFYHSQYPPVTAEGQPKALFFELPPIAERVPA